MHKIWSVSLIAWIYLLIPLFCAAAGSMGLADHAQTDDAPVKIDVGVGFSLSLDYATSAIYLPNHTYHTVAKLEGTPRYKQLMRQVLNEVNRGIPSDDYLKCRPAPQPQWPPTILQATLQQLSFKYPIRNPFPNWGPQKPANQEIFESILAALKTATESYIGGTIHNAVLAFPVLLPCKYLNLIQDCLTSLNIQATFFPGQTMVIPAYAAAAEANGVTLCFDGKGVDCKSPHNRRGPPLLGLFVDYSRAALDISLFSVDHGLIDPQGGQRMLELGGDNLMLGDETAHWESIRKVAQEVLRAPRENMDPAIPRQIGQLVLSGELGYESNLQRVLKYVLAGQVAVQHVDMANICNNTGNMADNRVNPQFAAAVGAAFFSWVPGTYINCDLPPDPYFSYPDSSQGNCMAQY